MLFAFAVSTPEVTTQSSHLPVDDGHVKVHYSSIVKSTGSSVNLSCASDTQDVPFWDYYPYIGSQTITIYNGGERTSEHLDPRFSVDLEGCRAYKCSLKIENVQLKDAGRFVCWESRSVSRHLSLTVLGQ